MPKDNQMKTRFLVLSAVLTALVFLATQLKIPIPLGYVHLGDGVILVSAYLLGPWAFFAAGVGSSLADLLSGYVIYAPATLVIKGLMAFLAGWLFVKVPRSWISKVIICSLAQGLMVLGYFGFESVLYGVAAAAVSILPNLGQASAGIVLAFILTPFLVPLPFYPKKSKSKF